MPRSLRLLIALLCHVTLAACAMHDPAPLSGRDFKAYSLVVGWAPTCGPGSDVCALQTPPGTTWYLWALRQSIPQDLERAGHPTSEWRDRGCALYAPVVTPKLMLPAPDIAALKHAKPSETERSFAWEYAVRAQCFGFSQAEFFGMSLRAYSAFLDSPIARVLTRHMGAVVARADLEQALAQEAGITNSQAVRLRCEQTGTGPAMLSSLYIGIRFGRLSAFPDPATLVTEPEVATPCPDHLLIPAPATGPQPSSTPARNG